eukprot:3423582-Amphidinium_carterae.1
MANAVYSASIYYRRAEDISIEFVPERNGQEARIDTSAQSTLWLDHLISAWAITDTQWHLNEFTAIAMLSPHSMSQTFRNWCDQNNLTVVLNSYLEADGAIKQQYVVADNGVEHDHKQILSLHRWRRDNHMVLTNQQMTMRVNNAGNGTELHWTSPVTNLHSSVSMTFENEASQVPRAQLTRETLDEPRGRVKLWLTVCTMFFTVCTLRSHRQYDVAQCNIGSSDSVRNEQSVCVYMTTLFTSPSSH